jgi:hypothetical protein
MCDVLLPPGVNPTAVKYIYISYHKIQGIYWLAVEKSLIDEVCSFFRLKLYWGLSGTAIAYVTHFKSRKYIRSRVWPSASTQALRPSQLLMQSACRFCSSSSSSSSSSSRSSLGFTNLAESCVYRVSVETWHIVLLLKIIRWLHRKPLKVPALF